MYRTSETSGFWYGHHSTMECFIQLEAVLIQWLKLRRRCFRNWNIHGFVFMKMKRKWLNTKNEKLTDSDFFSNSIVDAIASSRKPRDLWLVNIKLCDGGLNKPIQYPFYNFVDNFFLKYLRILDHVFLIFYNFGANCSSCFDHVLLTSCLSFSFLFFSLRNHV